MTPNPLHTSLPAPMYIYADCLFRMLFLSTISTAYYLLSGSGAARLLLNWLIDWLIDCLSVPVPNMARVEKVTHIVKVSSPRRRDIILVLQLIKRYKTPMVNPEYPIDPCRFRWPSVTCKAGREGPNFPPDFCTYAHLIPFDQWRSSLMLPLRGVFFGLSRDPIIARR